MKSSVNGKLTLKAEVTNISIHGIWLLFGQKEFFLPFPDFPWFKEARLAEVQNIQVVHDDHLYWPDLDVDLSIQMLENLESYPLVWK
jgi:hypothetical protein